MQRPLAQAFSRRRVLVVGDLVADHYIYGRSERVSREAPVLIVRYESAEVKLGGGANAAANVKSLGGQVTVVGVLGDDEMGGELRRLCKAAGIRLVATSAPGLETETKTRILAGGVNTTRQQMLRLDRGAPGPLPAKVRSELAREVASAAQSVDAVLVSDYGAGVVSEEVRQVLRDLARQGLVVCADSRHHLRALTQLTVCKPNEPELEALTGMSVRSEKELVAAAARGLKLLGSQALVVTRGRNGIAVFEQGKPPHFIPVHGAAEAVDVTGAGDTVMAALTLALAAKGSLGEAARLANVAGALVVQKQGTATVSRAELQRELSGAEA
ncbi:MAG: bifunctional heptose 7-phosphate kinase/heptose 1-phosphate adenyltransferase [Myxococcota bacterium]